MMKWRVQKKQPRRKDEGRLVIAAPNASPEDVKASLDYLDSVIEEYNYVSTPSPTPVRNGTGNGSDVTSSPSPTNENGTLETSPPPTRRSPTEEDNDDLSNVSLIVIRDVVTTRLSPPPVPRRGPRSCCRNREYPVSPPPRRRYTSPERRMKAALQNNAKPRETSLKRNPSSPAFNPAYQRHDPNNNVTGKVTDVASTPPKCDNHHRVTVTFRTVAQADTPPPLPSTSPPSSPVTPPGGTFRRKIESRNSIHVDFNVKDACGQNASWPGSDLRGKTAEEGKFCRTRSLRGLRRAVDDEAVTGTPASPPPLPPRKSRDDVKRGVQFAKRVTFYVNDGDVSNSRKDDVASRVTTTPGSPIIRIKTPVQEDFDAQDSIESVQDRVLIKTFEPSAVDDVPTNCYNVYNVRTGKISSSVHKPPLVGRHPLKSVGSNGSALERLRSISPTREAAEKFIGKIISKCKSTAGANKEKKMASERQPRLTKQQRHSRCTKCAVAMGK